MKTIFLICLSAGLISTGFAQSSVADVPENKIKPAYEVVQPAKKNQLQQKQLSKNTEQAPVVITDNNSSVYSEDKKEMTKVKPGVSSSVVDMPVNKATPQTVDKTGSVMDTPAAKPAVKKADNSGSVAPETKKEAVKPVDNSSSVKDIPPVKRKLN